MAYRLSDAELSYFHDRAVMAPRTFISFGETSCLVTNGYDTDIRTLLLL